MRQTPNWSDEQLATLRSMFEEGASDEAIGQAIGRTSGAVCFKRYTLKLNRDEAGIRRAPTRRVERAAPVTSPPIAPAAPRSLTAEIFGDPQPGRSALDRMRAGR